MALRPLSPAAVPIGDGTGYNSTGTFNPYTYAPQSAHILWTKMGMPLQNGLVGGDYGSVAFTGEGGTIGHCCARFNTIQFRDPIIMGGYVYYTSAPEVGNTQIQGLNSSVADLPVQTETCANLQTGQVVWTVPINTSPITGGATPSQIGYGQILCWRSEQQRADLGYLWHIGSGSYQCWDASTGALVAQWANVAAGTRVAASGATITTSAAVSVSGGTVVNEPPNPTSVGYVGGASGGGAILVYISGHNTNQPTGWLACWNSTLAINSYNNNPVVWNIQNGAFPSITSQLQTPLDWQFGIMWNISLPLPITTNAAGANANSTWSILGCRRQLRNSGLSSQLIPRQRHTIL